jgi:hypothetical protein
MTVFEEIEVASSGTVTHKGFTESVTRSIGVMASDSIYDVIT